MYCFNFNFNHQPNVINQFVGTTATRFSTPFNIPSTFLELVLNYFTFPGVFWQKSYTNRPLKTYEWELIFRKLKLFSHKKLAPSLWILNKMYIKEYPQWTKRIEFESMVMYWKRNPMKKVLYHIQQVNIYGKQYLCRLTNFPFKLHPQVTIYFFLYLLHRSLEHIVNQLILIIYY